MVLLRSGIWFLVVGAVWSVEDGQTTTGMFTLDRIDFSQVTALLNLVEKIEPFSCWCSQTQDQEYSCPVAVPTIPQILNNKCGLQSHCCLHRKSIEVDTLQKTNITTEKELQSLVEEVNHILNPQSNSNDVEQGRKISPNKYVLNNDLIQSTSDVYDVKDNSNFGYIKPSTSNINTFDVNKFDVKTEVINFLQTWFKNSFIENSGNKTADDKLDNNSVRIVTYDELGSVLRGVELILDIIVQVGIFLVLGSLTGILLSGYGGFAFGSCTVCTIMDILYQLDLF